MTSWENDPTVTSTETIGGTTYYVYTFTGAVDDKTFNIKFRGGSAESDTKTLSYQDYAIHLFGEVKGEGSVIVWTPDASKTVYRTRLNGDWPGNSVTKVTSISTSSMIAISSDFYGQNVRVKFSDNGSSVKDEWSITINRDYDYGY